MQLSQLIVLIAGVSLSGFLYPFTRVQLSPMLAAGTTARSRLSVVTDADLVRQWQPREIDISKVAAVREPRIGLGPVHRGQH